MSKAKWPASSEGYVIRWWQNFEPTVNPTLKFDPSAFVQRLDKAKRGLSGFELLQTIQTETGGVGLIEWKTAEYDNALYWIRLPRTERWQPAGMYFVELRYFAVKRPKAR
jgi:hypothetical protein